MGIDIQRDILGLKGQCVNSGMCRHMSIQAVSRHLGIRRETVKNQLKNDIFGNEQ